MKNKILGNLSLCIITSAVLVGYCSDDKDELPTVSFVAAISLK